jgi:hypothetical protein
MATLRPVRPWQAAVCAGLIAAVASLTIETPVVWLISGELPWAAARMTVAILLGPQVLSPPSFDVRIVALAFAIHFALSIFYASVLAWIVHGETVFHASITGAAFGVVVFFLNMFALTDIFFPWFVELRNAITFCSHIVLGAVMGGSYVAIVKAMRRSPL